MHRLAFFDLDGVLADERHRAEHALHKDWGNYFDPVLVRRDGVFAQGRAAYENTLLAGFDVAYLTGRREDLRPTTVKWLRRHGFDETLPLVMRDYRHTTKGGFPLARLKAAIVAEARHIYDEVWLFDDDVKVIDAVRQVQGVRAVHCTWHVKPTRLVNSGVA
jgi:phosphoglycolate phosphatase-like HAD superfamily hydrolase